MIKLTVPAINRGLISLLPVSGTPPITHRYDGISGRMHGDKNDSNPALKARNIDNSSIISDLILVGDIGQVPDYLTTK